VTDALGRLTAVLADRYVIERELGAGGMATVYLARDVRHDRQVALKVLRPELASILGAERFLSEIKTTANLQHPHILPLFDSGEADGLVFYVMPYVEGESLHARLTREKQLPVEDAVRIAVEVADALAYAHRHGVVHRDIKPENIMLAGGHALVADFGIALAASRTGGGTRLTETGMSLGTPAYMAPEQAMGEKDITPRADIYALGCVLYEMLAGEPPFTGPTAQAIVAQVLTEAPRSLTLQRRTVPPHVEAAVERALEKLPADRFASAAQFAAALERPDAQTPGRTDARRSGAPVVGARRGRVVAVSAAALAVAVAAGWALRGWRRPTTPPAPVRFAFTLGHPGLERPYVAISPDGRRIAEGVMDSAGIVHIVERDLGSTTLRTIAGTEGGQDPTYSPDGKWIAFTIGPRIEKVPADGGTPTLVTDSGTNQASAWLPDGSLIVSARSGLVLVPASGGPVVPLTHLDTARHEFQHWNPQVLPGGHAVIYASYATPASPSRIEVVDLGTHRRTVLADDAAFPRYAPGYLLYARARTIFAVKFDPATLKVSGTPVPVQGDVNEHVDWGLAGYDVAANGTLVYLSASAWDVPREVVWVDRAGRARRALPDTGSWAEPRLSPDGRWIALTALQPRSAILLYDLRRGILSALTHAPGAAFGAVWTPDGRRIIYSYEDPIYDLHVIAADGSGDVALVSSKHDKYASSVSSDGRWLVYTEVGESDRVWIAPPDGRGQPRPLDSGELGSEQAAAFSPDGRWIAYAARVNGRYDVYLRRSDGTGGSRQVSAHGGAEPRWTRGGREIVYLRGAAVMAVAVNPATGEAGTPVRLFDAPAADLPGSSRDATYDVTPDGSRFLMVRPVARSDAPATVVVLHWFSELDAKLKP